MKFLKTAISQDAMDRSEPVFFYIKDMNWKIALDPTEPDGTKTSKVGAEWKSFYLGVKKKIT